MEFYDFGNFRLSPAERYLLHKGEAIQLTPKAFDTLYALVRRSGHLVTKEELLNEVWQDAFVEEATVVQNISTLRKILSRDGRESRFIETVPKRGYRFVADVITSIDDGSVQPVRNGSKAGSKLLVTQNGDKSNSEVGSDKLNDGTTTFPAGVFRELNPPGVSARPRSLSTIWIITLLTLLVVIVAAILIVRSLQRSPSVDAPFAKMSLGRITRTGKVITSAISPDGKYVAYVARDAGKESLWLRQVSAPNDAEIMPPMEVQYLGLSFSPDGNYVYFINYVKGKIEASLYRIPTIGGSPQRVLTDIDSPVTFSPDGKQIAFVRGYPANHETAIVVAYADGTNEQKLASRIFPAFFSVAGPAWSPDASVIACGVRNPDPQEISETVLGIEIANRKEFPLTEQTWAEVGRLSWHLSGARIILTAAEEPGLHQLWQISRPSGVASRITNDLNDYRGVSLTSSMNALATVEREAKSSIWITSGPQFRGTELNSSSNDGQAGISWTPDGRLVFASGIGLQSDIWIIDADGGPKKPLITNNRRDFAPIVTRDGRFLVYSSAEDGSPAKLWRTNLDGSDPKQLTFGNDDRFPASSADSKWVLYSAFAHDGSDGNLDERLWRVPIDGGESSQVVSEKSTRPTVSPDGKMIAFSYHSSPTAPWLFRIISYETRKLIKDLPVALPSAGIMQWAPDSLAVTYVETRDGVSNIWRLPLDGTSAKQITHFESGQIFRFAWSHDGKRMAIVRGVPNGDVVLIRDFG